MMLQDRVAFITGAGRGIGAEIARTFAAAGADLVIVARTRVELERTATECRSHGRKVVPIAADVSNEVDVSRAIAAATAAYQSIDILVNNAGVIGPVGPFCGNNLFEWWHTLEVNLGGALRLSQALIPQMIQRRAGKIINLSGGGATAPRPNLSAYAVSKAAIVRLTETLADELKTFNIQVNAIAPGAVDTRIQDELIAAGALGGEATAEAQRHRDGSSFVPPRLAAELALFLASPDSDGLTGKLVSAPHDPWRQWAGRGPSLSSSPMYTLRRLDPHTLRQVKSEL